MRVRASRLPLTIVPAILAISAFLQGQAASSGRPTVAHFQQRIDAYGRLWTMTDGKIDLSPLDQFYAPDGEVIIFDFAPPGVSRNWAEHRRGLERELFSKLLVNRFVPRQDVTLRLIGDNAAVTTFTFDYENQGKDGKRAKVTGRQTNVWERRGAEWVIVHEHGSPVPKF